MNVDSVFFSHSELWLHIIPLLHFEAVRCVRVMFYSPFECKKTFTWFWLMLFSSRCKAYNAINLFPFRTGGVMEHIIENIKEVIVVCNVF